MCATLNESTLYRTLASSSRIEILKVLQRGPLSVEEISQKLNLQAITIRHHLQALTESGIVECHEERSGTAGRPRAYYSIVKTFPSISFPKRLYQSLSESLINGMIEEFGVDKTKIFLRKVGIASGEAAIRELKSKHGIRSWSMDDYKRYVIGEFLEQEGNEPEIIETTNNKVVYRLHNCLFRELSAKMPEIMCDVLHESFYEGVSKAMGKDVKTTRSTCMGHGDQYCEHVCVWGRQKR